MSRAVSASGKLRSSEPSGSRASSLSNPNDILRRETNDIHPRLFPDPSGAVLSSPNGDPIPASVAVAFSRSFCESTLSSASAIPTPKGSELRTEAAYWTFVLHRIDPHFTRSCNRSGPSTIYIETCPVCFGRLGDVFPRRDLHSQCGHRAMEGKAEGQDRIGDTLRHEGTDEC